jgi:hypothetical protein
MHSRGPLGPAPGFDRARVQHLDIECLPCDSESVLGSHQEVQGCCPCLGHGWHIMRKRCLLRASNRAQWCRAVTEQSLPWSGRSRGAHASFRKLALERMAPLPNLPHRTPQLIAPGRLQWPSHIGIGSGRCRAGSLLQHWHLPPILPQAPTVQPAKPSPPRLQANAVPHSYPCTTLRCYGARWN